MLTVRVRSRDGLERLQVARDANVLQLKEAISSLLSRPLTQFIISTKPELLTSKSREAYSDLANDAASLSQCGFSNGQMVYCYYDGEREVAPGYKKSAFDSRPFGAHMDVERLMAKQTRIERQDKPNIASASFDRFAANAFQAYVASALAFSIKRMGFLYGRIDDDKNVFVDVIYEPDQSGSVDQVSFQRDTHQDHAAEVIARHLGLQKVGFIFNQSLAVRDNDYIMSNYEIAQMCQVQDEVGEHCVTAVFVQEEVEGQAQIHLEAFQCSQQAVKLWKEGWFVDPAADPNIEISGSSKMRNPHDASISLPVMISGKDTDTVDNDFFLVPVPVKDHVGPLMTSFPAENRLIPQGADALKAHLRKYASKPYAERIADFHLLLWLALNGGFDLDTDIALLSDAIKEGQPVREGYQVMIDTMAGIS